MTAYDENWRAKAHGRTAPPAHGTTRSAGGAGLLGTVLARARSLVFPNRAAPAGCAASGADPVQSLDDRLLLDIGLAVDAVRREAPPVPWPH
jgi:hypothetical protein